MKEIPDAVLDKHLGTWIMHKTSLARGTPLG
jgi:hypothetical protein